MQGIGAVLPGAVNRLSRPAAEHLQVPLGTVHDWLRRARLSAPDLIGHVVGVAPARPLRPDRSPPSGR